jgi:hypothetical protein
MGAEIGQVITTQISNTSLMGFSRMAALILHCGSCVVLRSNIIKLARVFMRSDVNFIPRGSAPFVQKTKPLL